MEAQGPAGSPAEWEWVALESIALNPANPRVNDQAVEHVKASIARFGFLQPLVVNRRTSLILAGNTRYKASHALGLDRVPVVWVDMDELTATAYAIVDNRTHERSRWDMEALLPLLGRLEEEDMLASADFSAEEAAELRKRLEVPGDQDYLAAFGNLPQGEKPEIQTMSFSFSDSQAELVRTALKEAQGKERAAHESDIENKNSNALADICRQWLGENGLG